MTDHDYRTLPAYANSDLSELFNLRMGKPARTIPEKAARIGTIFHQRILEPMKPIDWSGVHVKDQYLIMQMADSFDEKIDLETATRIRQGKTEHVRQWFCPVTGLPLKAKLDSLLEHYPFTRHIITDLKSTSCKSSAMFFDSIIEYGYDRQAAFYLDSLGMAGGPSHGNYNFTFVAVQKIKPFDVWVINMNGSADRRLLIDMGRRKNERLLRDALAESKKVDGWRPSSWNRSDILV